MIMNYLKYARCKKLNYAQLKLITQFRIQSHDSIILEGLYNYVLSIYVIMVLPNFNLVGNKP